MIFFHRNSVSSMLFTSRTKVRDAWMIGTISGRSFSHKASPAYRRLMKKKYEESRIPSPVPTLAEVQDLPLGYPQMDSASLVHLAATGSHGARTEVLKRHIMGVDNVSYEEACKTFDVIARYNDKGLFFMALPYYIAIGSAATAAFVSFPLVFYEPVVHYFNETFVTADVPDPKDLETFLEVGSWSWDWMEPPLGQISFALLCLQHARGQMQNLGLKPYTRFLKHKRAERLASKFPQYDEGVIMNYAKSDDFTHNSK